MMTNTTNNKEDDGPGFYVLPTTVGTSSPAYSFGVRPPEASVRKMPGPQSYDVSELTRYGRSSAPSCKLGAKLQHGGWYPFKKVESPGPGAYSPEVYGSIQWKCSGSRTLLKDEPTASQHSMASVKSTTSKPRDEKSSPGPGSYDVTPIDAYKTRQPRIKMGPTLHQ